MTTQGETRPIESPIGSALNILRRPSVLLITTYGLIMTLVGVGLMWAFLTEIVVSVHGSGRVVPSGKVRVVQNLEGGIVREILVREGDLVVQGQLLVKIDETSALSTFNQDMETLMSTRAMISRLRAEMTESDTIAFDPSLQEPEFEALRLREQRLLDNRLAEVQEQRNQLSARIDSFLSQEQAVKDKIVNLRERITVLSELRDLREEQFEQGITSRAEVLTIRNEVTTLQGGLGEQENILNSLNAQLDEARSAQQGFEAERKSILLEQINKLEIEQTILNERQTAQRDRLVRRDVTAPVNGTVRQIFVSTRGQVLQPGQEILELVPTDDTLLIEARVDPKDIAFIHVGQTAEVRVTAYDASIYGYMVGEVETLGSDSIIDNRSGQMYYPVNIRVTGKRLNDEQDLPIIPGMMAEVDIRTGMRTVANYIFKPINKLTS